MWGRRRDLWRLFFKEIVIILGVKFCLLFGVLVVFFKFIFFIDLYKYKGGDVFFFFLVEVLVGIWNYDEI